MIRPILIAMAAHIALNGTSYNTESKPIPKVEIREKMALQHFMNGRIELS